MQNKEHESWCKNEAIQVPSLEVGLTDPICFLFYCFSTVLSSVTYTENIYDEENSS